jgi:two-component system chemotaxis response regulator CheB
MATARDVIAIGASAGGVETLSTLVAGLPARFGAALLVVLHIGRSGRSSLPEILARAGPLPAAFGRHGERIEPGRIYVAPPDHHLLIEPGGRIRLSRGPREHFTRPAIDPLFRAAASCCGPRVVGLLLSGAGRDGAAGLSAIRQAGGVAVVQDPRDAIVPGMLRNALEHIAVHAVAPAAALPALLVRLVAGEPVPRQVVPAPVALTGRPAAAPPDTIAGKEDDPMADADDRFQRPAALTCPECGGAVREERADGLKLYRCHIGHRFAAEELAGGQFTELERALNIALRVLNERAELARRMEAQLRDVGHVHLAARWEKVRRDAEAQIEVVRRFLERDWPQPEKDEERASGTDS